MKTRTIIKDDLSYIAFTEIYQKESSRTKGQPKAFLILEASIRLFARRGWEGVTLAAIAKEAGTSSPFVRHYFRDIEEIRAVAIKYIRVLLQERAVRALARESNPRHALAKYIEECFRWADESFTHARVWCSFLSSCVNNELDRQLNTAAVEAGHERILALVRSLSAAPAEAEVIARSIQIIITGSLVSYLTEDGPKAGLKRAAEATHLCEKLLS